MSDPDQLRRDPDLRRVLVIATKKLLEKERDMLVDYRTIVEKKDDGWMVSFVGKYRKPGADVFVWVSLDLKQLDVIE